MAETTPYNDLLDADPRSRVVRAVRRMIQEGALLVDDPLPSERALSASLEVNRRTVRAALEQLRAEGRIVTEGGRSRVAGEVALPDHGGLMTDAILVLTPDRPDPRGLAYALSATTGIGLAASDAARRAGYHAISLHPGRLEPEKVGRLMRTRPAGVVMTDIAAESRLLEAFLTAATANRVPLVAYGNHERFHRVDRVASDHEAGSYQLTRWLIEQGARRILWVGSMDRRLYWVESRLRGYARAMAEAGLEALPPDLPGATIDASAGRETFDLAARLFAGYLAPHFLTGQPVDAIMAVNDAEYFSVAAACRILGREPQVDVRIVGYDNAWHGYPQRAWEPTRPLATVDQNHLGVGAELVALLRERIESGTGEPRLRLLAPKLVVPAMSSP